MNWTMSMPVGTLRGAANCALILAEQLLSVLQAVKPLSHLTTPREEDVHAKTQVKRDQKVKNTRSAAERIASFAVGAPTETSDA